MVWSADVDTMQPIACFREWLTGDDACPPDDWSAGETTEGFSVPVPIPLTF